jgi:hypothetical protein
MWGTETPWRELAGLTNTGLPFLDYPNSTKFHPMTYPWTQTDPLSRGGTTSSPRRCSDRESHVFRTNHGLWYGAKSLRWIASRELCALGESSTILPPESTNILLNAASVEARWDTTINVEADR